MSINWDGFIMGVSDYGLERMKEERQKKMQLELLELKEKYAEAAEIRQRGMENRNVKRTRTEYDPTTNTGFEIDENQEGTELQRRSLSAGALEELGRNARKGELDIENTQSQIDARKEELALGRERLAIAREGNSIARMGAMSGSGDVSGGDPAEALVAQALSGISKPDATTYGRMRLLADKAVQSALDPREQRSVRSIYADLLANEPQFGDPMAEPRALPPIESYKPRAATPSFRFKLPGVN